MSIFTRILRDPAGPDEQRGINLNSGIAPQAHIEGQGTAPEPPTPRPAPGPTRDPETELVEALAVKSRLDAQLRAVRQRIDSAAPGTVGANPLDGRTLLRQRQHDAEALLAGGELSDTPANDLRRELEALQSAMQQVDTRIARLRLDVAPLRWEKVFADRHAKALRKKAKSLIDLMAADDECRAICFEAVKAGAVVAAGSYTPASMAPAIRFVNKQFIEQLVQNIRQTVGSKGTAADLL